MHRYRFVLLRPLQLLPVIFGVSVVTFVLVRLIPGDPARVLLGARATEKALANIREQYGLNEPIVVQYLLFLKNLLHGEMGRSIVYKIDVMRVIGERVQPTLLLVVASVALSVLIAAPLAALAARSRGGWVDNVIRGVTTLGIGFPPFWLALMLVLAFAIRIPLLPVAGWGDGWGEKAAHLALPALTVALSLSTVLLRSLRASMIEQLSSDMAVAARARGVSEARIIWRHVLPNAVVPTINLLAVNIGWLIGSTVVVESIFALPGLGQVMVKAIFSRDYMVVQGVAMTFAVATVIVNLLADVATVALDPRVKM